MRYVTVNSMPLSAIHVADCEECGVILDSANDPHEYLETPGGSCERVCVECLNKFQVSE